MPKIVRKRRKTRFDTMVSRKFTIGEKVIGIRSPDKQSGILVRSYVTINTNKSGTYRNPAYIVKCDSDGKERSFQFIKKVKLIRLLVK